MANHVSSAVNLDDPEVVLDQSPMYSIETYENLGKGICYAFLDSIDRNPHSRLRNTNYSNLHGVKVSIAEILLKQVPFRNDRSLRKNLGTKDEISNYVRSNIRTNLLRKAPLAKPPKVRKALTSNLQTERAFTRGKISVTSYKEEVRQLRTRSSALSETGTMRKELNAKEFKFNLPE
jgi:hypothetical protein